eukprot:7477888-Pyramimonas_sp.AAC.1
MHTLVLKRPQSRPTDARASTCAGRGSPGLLGTHAVGLRAGRRSTILCRSTSQCQRWRANK